MAVPNPPTTPRRVKVYELRNSDWFDRGTGYCTGQMLNDEPHIQVKSEEEVDKLLLDTKIVKDDGYQKQQETLIVWTEPSGTDMALSFQEPDGCAAIWDFVNHVQNRILSLSGADDILSDDNELVYSIKLPPPTLQLLGNIENMMHTMTISAAGRDSLAKFILNEDYIPKLLPLLETAEDMEMLPELFVLCRIMKTIILLNDSTIIEYIVTDEVVMGVVGTLEYDPDFPTHKANHRKYLSDETRFKEVAPIDDPNVKKKIHQTYRLQYLKDVVLARVLDDSTFTVLNSLIFFNQVDIVQHLQSNTNFLTNLFGLFTPPAPTTEAEKSKRKYGVQFLQQCTSIAKSLQAPSRVQLYTNFIDHGLFNVIDYALLDDDPATRIAGMEILVSMIDNDPHMMRQYIFKQIGAKNKPLTDTLIELLLNEQDLGVKAQIADAVKILLDPNQAQSMENLSKANEISNMTNQTRRLMDDPVTEKFFQNFYDESAKKLFKPLVDLENRTSVKHLTLQESALYAHLIEILCYFIKHHMFRNKYFILGENLASRVAQLLDSTEKHLKLSAVKFFRACVTLQDEFYNRQIVKHKLLEPILNIVIETMPKDNLLNSACLEFFEFIKKETIRPLINHLVDQYRDRLMQITYVDTFSSIINRYEQLHDSTIPSTLTSDDQSQTPNRAQLNGNRRWQTGIRDMDPSEEEYFNTSDDEDSDILYENATAEKSPTTKSNTSTTSVTTTSPITKASPKRKLVDYPDDEDEHPARNMDFSEDVNLDNFLANNPSESETGSHGTTTNPNWFSSLSSTSTNTDSPTSSLPPTPERLAEKRRREEEEEEDEMSNLSSRSSKKRTSPATTAGGAGKKTAAASGGAVSGNSGAPGSTGKKISISFSSVKSVPSSPVAESVNAAAIDGDASSDGGEITKKKEKKKVEDKEKEDEG